MIERISLRATQLAENKMDVEPSTSTWGYASTVTAIFIVFYALVSKEFNRIEDEHEEAEEDE